MRPVMTPAVGAVVAQHASARPNKTKRSLPEAGEFAYTSFIAAILIAAALRMSGSGSKMGAAGFRQARSGAVTGANRSQSTTARCSGSRSAMIDDTYTVATAHPARSPGHQLNRPPTGCVPAATLLAVGLNGAFSSSSSTSARDNSDPTALWEGPCRIRAETAMF